jgi:hypothetical protein
MSKKSLAVGFYDLSTQESKNSCHETHPFKRLKKEHDYKRLIGKYLDDSAMLYTAHDVERGTL